MKYLLDTDACIDYLTARYPSLTERLQQSAPEDLVLSAIVLSELRYGADKSRRKKRNHRLLDQFQDEIACLDFDSKAAAEYGAIRAHLERRGEIIGANDMLIAAHARALGVVLVTDNVAEFSRVPGLRVENWRA